MKLFKASHNTLKLSHLKLPTLILSVSIPLTAVLTGCGSQEEAKTDSAASADTVDRVELIIGSDMTFPPYEYIVDNEYKGLDIELMNNFAENSDFDVNWQDIRWTNLIPSLESEKVDALISGMYITKERLEKVDMIPYYKTDQALLVKSDSTYEPKTPEDLCGKTVGIQKGTAFVGQLNSITEEYCTPSGKEAITLREYETSPQTTQALLASAIDVQYDDSALATNAVKKLNGKIKISSTESFFPIVGGIAIRKGDTETREKIEAGLEKARESGEFKAIMDSYGLEIPTEEEIETLIK